MPELVLRRLAGLAEQTSNPGKEPQPVAQRLGRGRKGPRPVVPLEVRLLGSSATAVVTTTTEVKAVDMVVMADMEGMVATAATAGMVVAVMATNLVVLPHGPVEAAVTVSSAVAVVAVLLLGCSHLSSTQATVLLEWTTTPRRLLHRRLVAFLLPLRRLPTTFLRLPHRRSSGPLF